MAYKFACSVTSLILIGAKRDTEDRIVPRSVDADDSDVEVKSDDERYYSLPFMWIT